MSQPCTASSCLRIARKKWRKVYFYLYTGKHFDTAISSVTLEYYRDVYLLPWRLFYSQLYSKVATDGVLTYLCLQQS